MTCCEGWTACNGFSLLVLLLLGVTLNAIPLIVNLVDEDHSFQNPISCFEWWFPGIIGAGLMVIPATTMSLAARKRACCNNKTGVSTARLGREHKCITDVSASPESPEKLITRKSKQLASGRVRSAYRPEPFNLQWFFNDSCVSPTDFNTHAVSDPGAWGGGRYTLHFNSTENRHRIIHFSVFLGLLLVGILELLFGLSQIIIGFLGCLCGGVSKRRGRIV
ncbi:Transmembrane 4 L6 family member 20 [Camelus dromedarius]|uniref:Transmembrane 4 L6 family member 20 n=1 Tax=Camelus dromedarius TaxID=9838 RepID=A0A5N4E5G4_CAMDR|nr:Transmembrane 4 L6 family member 20 [Camelus dromedarius]